MAKHSREKGHSEGASEEAWRAPVPSATVFIWCPPGAGIGQRHGWACKSKGVSAFLALREPTMEQSRGPPGPPGLPPDMEGVSLPTKVEGRWVRT